MKKLIDDLIFRCFKLGDKIEIVLSPSQYDKFKNQCNRIELSQINNYGVYETDIGFAKFTKGHHLEIRKVKDVKSSTHNEETE